MSLGEQQKRRAATQMNDRSTRAHSLFIMSLKQTMAPQAKLSLTPSTNYVGNEHEKTAITIQSRLYLADLGGSEQVKKSGVEAGILREGETEEFSLGFQMGEHMREAVNINLGLLALKKCIECTYYFLFI